MLATLVVLHFILLNFLAKVSPYVQKELGIALVYSIGIALPAFSLSPFSFTLPIWIILLQVFLLAYINLIEFSLFEVKEDVEEGQISIARILGVRKTAYIIKVLLLINFLIALINLTLNFTYQIFIAEIILIVMNSSLFCIYWQQEKLRINERYRIVGDAIFILPGLLYFLM
jgi:4-hydroxybenzoate polyprenyltransferase